jgi:hypothetical protein
VTPGFPPAIRKKAVYFVKRPGCEGALDAAAMAAGVAYGDLASSPLEQLLVLLQVGDTLVF